MQNDDTSLILSVFGLLEHLKKIHANKIRTCRRHAERPQPLRVYICNPFVISLKFLDEAKEVLVLVCGHFASSESSE